VSSLWLYAENNLCWGAKPPKQWHKAYVEAAGAASKKNTAKFFTAPPVDIDGQCLVEDR
jgi:hypothetical protein